MNKKVSLVLRWVFLIVVLVALYAPIALIVVYSFSSEKDIGGANGFGSFTFSWYVKLFQSDEIMSAMWNTLIIGLVSASLLHKNCIIQFSIYEIIMIWIIHV